MIKLNGFRSVVAATVGVAMAGLVLPAFGSPGPLPQHKGGGGGGGRGGGGGGGQHGGGGVAHANREPVRTRNFVSHPGQMPAAPRQQPLPQVSPNRVVRRPNAPVNPAIRTQRTFTKTTQGRRYDNGLVLRKGIVPTKAWQKRWFPKGHFHFPFYRGRFVAGQCFISPFGFYFGLCCPWINVSACFVAPPAVAFVDMPVYSGNTWGGWADSNDPNYLNDQSLDQDEPGLNNALDELTETFQNGDIDGLVSLVNPNMRVAIYEEGQYKYSMNSNDFVDLTRDALQSTHTVSFAITYLHQRAPDVFSASAQHVYQETDGSTRTVYVDFVLQDIGGLWTLTQVQTCPDVLQTPQ